MILKHITKSHNQQLTIHVTPTTTFNSRETCVKSTNISPPQLQAEMTHFRFWKFKVDWDLHKRPNTIIAAQLYHFCNDALQQNTSIHSHKTFQPCCSSLNF